MVDDLSVDAVAHVGSKLSKFVQVAEFCIQVGRVQHEHGDTVVLSPTGQRSWIQAVLYLLVGG
jgi:hypothetical protein